MLSELDQAIAEHACVAQETKSTSSGASASALLRLREELARQVEQTGEQQVNRMKLEEYTRGIPLPSWIPASISNIVGRAVHETPVAELVAEAIQSPRDVENIQ